jgi:hypothetical protein
MIAALVRLCGECAVQQGGQAAHGVTVESGAGQLLAVSLDND